jgi:hypothetical protein
MGMLAAIGKHIDSHGMLHLVGGDFQVTPAALGEVEFGAKIHADIVACDPSRGSYMAAGGATSLLDYFVLHHRLGECTTSVELDRECPSLLAFTGRLPSAFTPGLWS